MAKITSDGSEQRTVMAVADLMVAAARTAPKACGEDAIEAFILTGDEKDALAAKMKEIGTNGGPDFFIRDGNNVDESPCIVMVGVANIPIALESCGLCGHGDCAGMAKAKGRCAFKNVDLGIAIGSMVSIAADNRVDNRILFSAGKAAVDMGLFPDNVKISFGIPLSVTGKSPYYDRAEQAEK